MKRVCGRGSFHKYSREHAPHGTSMVQLQMRINIIKRQAVEYARMGSREAAVAPHAL